MKKSDIILGLVIGELIALLSLPILKNLGIEIHILYWIWPILLPILTLIGLLVAFYIGKKIRVIWEMAKFIVVGALNTFVDLGVLNILIFFTGIATGAYYSVFKGISFFIATVNSYLWNKNWTFSNLNEDEEEELTERGKEFGKFILVSGIGFIINVSAATIMVNLIGPALSIEENILANLGGIFAAFCSMTWNFLGYKFLVFKD